MLFWILFAVSIVIVLRSCASSSLAGSLLMAFLVPFGLSACVWIVGMIYAYDDPHPHGSITGSCVLFVVFSFVVCSIAAMIWHGIKRPETTKNKKYI
jgi:hypothetical protein